MPLGIRSSFIYWSLAFKKLTRDNVFRCFHRSLYYLYYFETHKTFVSSFPVTRKPQGHTPSAFLFLSTTMSISGELSLQPPFQAATLSGMMSDRQDPMPVSPFREAGSSRRSLQISYGGIGAEAPVSLSSAVYRFTFVKVSSNLCKFFQDSFIALKKMALIVSQAFVISGKAA